LASASDSELYLAIIWVVGASTVALALAVLLIVVGLRNWHVWRARRRQRLRERWRPVVLESLYALPNALPRLPRRDLVPFLELWNHIFEVITGPARDGLVRLAERLGVVQANRALLRTRAFRRRLLAVVTCGHLRDRHEWGRLKGYLRHPNSVLSLAAARALVEIDPRRAVRPVMAQVLRRSDWPPGKVAVILEEADPQRIAHILTRALERAPSAHRPRLLRYLSLVRTREAQDALARFLERGDDPRLIALALQELQDPRHRRLVYRFADHPDWYVRVQVANALRRLGTVRDLPLLVRLMGDSAWWVRYRAAQAVVHLTPSSEWQRLRRFLDRRDPYARDIFEQAVAEATLTEAA